MHNQDCLVLLVHLVHLGFLDVQVIQDKDLQDHLDLRASQVMEDQDLKEIKETQVFHPALEHFIKDHLDLLGFLGLKDQQVLLDHVDTKVNQDQQVHLAPQEALREC